MTSAASAWSHAISSWCNGLCDRSCHRRCRRRHRRDPGCDRSRRHHGDGARSTGRLGLGQTAPGR
jgi:hypothetical protein